MDYKKHYDALMQRAKNRCVEGYTERHHIVPKCLGGSNDEKNLVRLTAPEHYLAHQLLVKLNPGHKGIIWSAMAMTNYAAVNADRSRNKSYGWLREKLRQVLVEMNKGRVVSEETRKKQSLARRGKKRKPHSEETKQKMSLAAIGKKKSASHIEKMIKSKTGVKTGPRSEETKRKISESNKTTWANKDKSYYNDDAYKKAQSEKMKLVWAKRKAERSLSINTI